MSKKKADLIIFGTMILLILVGVVLYIDFDRRGLSKSNKNNTISYNVKDYVESYPVMQDEYLDVFSSVNVSYVNLINLDSSICSSFFSLENELNNYIDMYYDEIKSQVGSDYIPVNTVSSTIKTSISNAVLSIYYELDFGLDGTYFNETVKKYFITFNVDLGTNKVIDSDDLFIKYDYKKEDIAEKIYEYEIRIPKDDILIDKESNLSFTGEEIEKKKEKYVQRISLEFDNIIRVYIENNSLVVVYNNGELKELFFDYDYTDELVFRYLG